MPQQEQYDWKKAFSLENASPLPAPPPAEKKEKEQKSEKAPKSGEKYDWKKAFSLENATSLQSPPKGDEKPSEKSNEKKPYGNILTTSIFKGIRGEDFGEMYDKFVEAFPDAKKSKISEFAAEMARMGPEVMDAATSPAGMALMAAHAHPRTRGAAMIVDAAFGAYQGVKAVPDLAEWVKNPTDPKKAATALKDLLYTYGLVKASKAGAQTAYRSAVEDSGARAREALQKFDELAPQKGDKKTAKREKANARGALWDEITTPKTRTEKIAKALYSSPLTRTTAAVVGVKRPTALEMGKALVDERRNFINLEAFRTGGIVDTILKNTTAEDRTIQKLGYVLQGDATPEEVGLSEGATKILPLINEWRAKEAQMLRDAYGGRISLQDSEEYLAQRWKFKDDKSYRNRLDELGRRVMSDPYLKSKKIGSYKEGIEELGLEPLFNDVTDIMLHRSKAAANAIANRRMSTSLSNMEGIISAETARKRGLQNWPTLSDANSLYRATYAGKSETTNWKGDLNGKKRLFKVQKFGNDPSVHVRWMEDGEAQRKVFSDGEGAQAYLEKLTDGTARRSGNTEKTVQQKYQPPHVNPNIKMAVDAVFGSPYFATSSSAAVLENLRAFSKRGAAFGSAFHNWSEMEQAQAEHLGSGNVKAALKATWFGNPEYWRGMKAGLWHVIKKQDHISPGIYSMDEAVVESWIKRGMDFHTVDSEQKFADWVQKWSESKGIKGKAAETRMLLSRLNRAGQMPLFEYYMPTQMVGAAESIMTREIQRLGKDATPEQIEALGRNISKHVNTAFGTGNMERMLISPKARQVLNWVFFAPAWTMSNVQILTSGFENETQQRLRSKWMRGAVASWFVSTQAMNYALSSWYGGTDKNGVYHKPGSPGWFSWDNPGLPATALGVPVPGLTENTINIYAGANPDGSQRYIHFGKGYREAFGWLMSPKKTLGGKLSIPLKVAATVMTGSEPGSGYQVINPRASEGEKAIQTAAEILATVTPFAADDLRRQILRGMAPEITPEGGTSQMLGLPVAKGATMSGLTAAYKQAKENQDDGAAEIILKVVDINHYARSRIIRAYKQDKTQREKTKRGPRIRYDSSGREAPPN